MQHSLTYIEILINFVIFFLNKSNIVNSTYTLLNILNLTCYNNKLLIFDSMWMIAIKLHVAQKEHIQQSDDNKVQN